MPSLFLVFDDFRRHIHRRASETVIHGQTVQTWALIRRKRGIGDATGPLYCPLILDQNFGCTEIYQFDGTSSIEENVCNARNALVSDDLRDTRCVLSGLMSR